LHDALLARCWVGDWHCSLNTILLVLHELVVQCTDVSARLFSRPCFVQMLLHALEGVWEEHILDERNWRGGSFNLMHNDGWFARVSVVAIVRVSIELNMGVRAST